jgi:hypothetical protein
LSQQSRIGLLGGFRSVLTQVLSLRNRGVGWAYRSKMDSLAITAGYPYRPPAVFDWGLAKKPHGSLTCQASQPYATLWRSVLGVRKAWSFSRGWHTDEPLCQWS